MSAPAIRHPESRVYETADDAAVSKLSAIRHGYFNDPFLGLFVRRFQRRSPLINRGETCTDVMCLFISFLLRHSAP